MFVQQEERKKLKILVVDDTPNNSFVMETLLGEIQEVVIELSTALNGESALSIVNDMTGDPFTHIFLDLQMPIMDGYQVEKELAGMKARGTPALQGTKIIALSATTLSQFKKHVCGTAAAFDIFSK